jgi:hypothetical protein
MKIHEEERDIYGTVVVQGREYFLLENRPIRNRPAWMPEGTVYWLVANQEEFEFNVNGLIYSALYIVFDGSALIELLPVPLTKKVIRFYVTDDEEA